MAREKLTYHPVELDTLDPKVLAGYVAYKAAYKAAMDKVAPHKAKFEAQFEALLVAEGALAAGQVPVIGYNFGRLSVAFKARPASATTAAKLTLRGSVAASDEAQGTTAQAAANQAELLGPDKKPKKARKANKPQVIPLT